MQWKDAMEVLTAMEDDVPMKLNYMILMGFRITLVYYTVNNYVPYTITMHHACIIYTKVQTIVYM